ncbi:3-beta hydroxysteroid dehydrogenase/isomerase [Macroventuria anomochaeta]|uniref:3-beta hydroxysteroid dehydrogenase/isomerase n=1 Tax=Macroventuria anomochaeta TaxID=301207 RepID=A0ACB6S953_9PLEO|nr:3-beta hydroxysteroid dehydrogenase/isomerase [Macroventuria anomochaeta]KAF2630736.1 3-beta hydroxysteroid dehydrogenase/isomerase [Macroventuria anomochaeta]
MSTERTRILVTGGCGFLGTEIVSALLATKRYDITTIDINPPALGTSTFTQSVRYVRANILDRDALQKVFDEAKPAMVVHTVGVYRLGTARYSMKNKEGEFTVNVEGTRNVLDASKECGAKGLVYTSSVTVVLDELGKDFRNVDEQWPTGRAKTSYGQSKTIAENLVLSATTASRSFATCSLRSAPIFGPNDPTVIPTVHACIAAYQTPFVLGAAAENLQDYVYVSNVADAHVLAVANLLNSQTAAGEAFFITNGAPVPLRILCLSIWKEFGHVPAFEVKIPEGVAWWMGLEIGM